MAKAKLKAWYGIDDQFHLTVKIGKDEYGVSGGEHCDKSTLINMLVDTILHHQLGFTAHDLLLKACNATVITTEETEHGFPTETVSY